MEESRESPFDQLLVHLLLTITMKAFIALFALVALTTVSADPDKYEMMLKKWGKMKAMEGCFGAENMKNYMMKMKKAKAMCSHTAAPELNLPMFTNKMSSANAFLNAGKNEVIDGMMREAFIKTMLKKQLLAELLEDHSDDFPFNVKNRHTRQAAEEEEEEEDVDVAILVKKIAGIEMKMMSEIGNMTCVLQTMGFLTEDMELDVAGMDKMVDGDKWAAEDSADGVDRTWLASELKHIHTMCKEFSDAVPLSILDNCQMPHYLTKIIYFKKCKGFHKKEACMMSDVYHKMTSHGVDVEKMAEEAGKDVETTVALTAFVMADSML